MLRGVHISKALRHTIVHTTHKSTPLVPSASNLYLPTTTSARKMATATTGKVQAQIESKLTQTFTPSHLEVINESYKHNVPKGSETHFKVVVVSDSFTSKTLIDQHRMVNDTLKEELATNVHALSIQTKTPQQWEASGHAVSSTPSCIRPPSVPMK